MDNKLKNELSKIKDNIELPDSYKFKFKKTLDTLPSNVKSNKFKFCSLKVSVAVALISTLTIGSVVFGEDVKVIKDNIISFFNGKPTTTVGLKDKIESINTPVNISDEHDGVKFTLENMSIDNNFLLCSYSIKADSENLLSEITGEMFKYFSGISYEINGEQIYSNYGHNVEKDNYKKSDTEIKLMERVNLGNFSIKDSGDTSISIYNKNYTNCWQINTSYDKTQSNLYTKTIEINKTISFGENNYNPMTIKKVCLSPLGNQITIETYGNTETISTIAGGFALLDDKNNNLTILNKNSLYYNEKSITSIEFSTPSTDISSIKLVPIYYKDNNKDFPTITELYDLDNMPSSIDLGDIKIAIKNVSFENNEIKLRYHYDGFNINRYYLEVEICDENGNQLGDANDHGYINHIIDRSSNSFVETYGFYTEANLKKAKKIRFYMDPPNTIKNDEAVTIKLN